VLLAGLCVGVAGLAKGPVAIVNVGLPIVLWRLVGPADAVPRVRARWWLGALVLSLAPMVGWAASASAVEPSLASELFFGQHAGRVTQGDRHPGPIWKHLTRMPLLLLPWTGAVLVGLGAAWRALLARRRPDVDRGLLLAGLWLAGLFLFYSAIPPKRDLYLLPAYPAAGLLAAWAVVAGMRGRVLPRWAVGLGPVALALVGALLALAGPLAVGLASLPPVGPLAERTADLAVVHDLPGIGWRAMLAGLGFLAAAWWAARAAARGGTAAWARAQALGWAAATGLLGALVFPPIDAVKSARPVALELAARPDLPSAIPTVGVQCEGYRFYSRGRVPTVLAEADELSPFLEREGGRFLAMVRASSWDRIPADVRDRLRPTAFREVGGKDILLVVPDGGEPAPNGP
jgi:4-amino-4-deoxy-L-arabinose transferase-like glycosyltransferase